MNDTNTWSIHDTNCPECMKYYFEQPFLLEACASVGIEHGKSTGLMLKEYFESFHARGHKEAGA